MLNLQYILKPGYWFAIENVEETLAVFEINLKVNDLHFEFKYHTPISVFS